MAGLSYCISIGHVICNYVLFEVNGQAILTYATVYVKYMAELFVILKFKEKVRSKMIWRHFSL